MAASARHEPQRDGLSERDGDGSVERRLVGLHAEPAPGRASPGAVGDGYLAFGREGARCKGNDVGRIEVILSRRIRDDQIGVE